MALIDLIGNARCDAILQVRINGVLLNPTNANDDTGVPGVLSAEWDDTAARIDLNNCPPWIQAGQSVTIDAGLRDRTTGITAIERQWTGTLLELPGEDPTYLRDKVLVTGAVIEVGSPPDNVQQQISAAATLVGADIRPPLPAGVHIEHEVPIDLVWTSTRASWLATQLINRFGMVPRYPTGSPNRQSISCTGSLYSADRAYQLGPIDIGGLTDETTLQLLLARAGVTAYSLIEPDIGWYTFAADATLAKGRLLDMMLKVMLVGQLEPVNSKDGVLTIRQVKWGPALTAAWTFDTTDQTKARILSATGELEVIWSPQIEKFSTGQLTIPFLQVNGLYFVESVRHVWPAGGMPVTRIKAMGGSRLGGTIEINPVATFRYTSFREVFGATTVVIASFDAAGSFDPDGTIASYLWADNQGTSINGATTPQATVNADTTAWTGAWTVTLTVTDNDGLDHSVSIDIPYQNTDTGLLLPATYVAHTSGASASLDGADLLWNDVSGATCISVGAKPADGTETGVACYGFTNGVIKRTTDGAASALSTVYTFPSATAVNYIAWDWRNTQHVWAISEQCELAVSADAGATWGLYGSQGLRTTLGLAGALGNRIGLPGAGGVYIFGGNGAGTPLIAYNSAGIFGAASTIGWVQVIMTGHPAADFPADGTMRIVEYSAPGYADGTEVMILAWSSGGGGSITAVYSTTDPPGPSRSFTRAGTTFGGLKTGKYIVGDNPLTTPQFHCAFANRSVWDSTDGITWSEKTNVLPAGLTPNFALFMSDVLTGIDGLFGVYMVAAENAGGTLGLYKSSDGLDTVDVVRGTGAAATAAPAGYKPRMIAVGAPGNSPAASGQLARLGVNNGLKIFDGSSHWATRGDSAGTIGSSLLRLPGGNWVMLDDPGNTGQLYHSADDGVTFSAVGPTPDANRGVYSVDVGADGTLWAAYSDDNSATNGKTTRPLLIYTSTDQGATWSDAGFVDPGFTGGGLTDANTCIWHDGLTADKTDANNIYVLLRASTTEGKAVYSTDGGASWTYDTTESGLTRGAAASNTPKVQFVANHRIVYVSENTAVAYYADLADWTAWSTSASSLGGGAEVLAPYRQSWFNKMFVAINPTGAELGRVWMSVDNGVTWTDLLGADVGFIVAGIEYDGASDTLYIGRAGTAGVAKIEGVTTSPTLTDITNDAGNASAGTVRNILALQR